ncbi:hypothetical protein BDN71DRAFT_1511148 [Pleurotus eryngii]|uniref:Uncharacterized protein n=1 Tax=Pleurotus eryngii TaxID=5323 RepID=A0A9P5ZRP3_PLEER|nr:hypothetical protein BDN71DRAFT_1511148 [Pleurotus eryngii]
MPASQVRLSTFGAAPQPTIAKGSAFEHPSNDLIAQFAEHCAQTTTKLLGASPLYFDQPAFSTPPIQLGDFIEGLLRVTNAPLSAAVASLAIIYWTTEAGACPLASSSPHHLFMAVHQAVLHPAWDFRDVDEDWVEFAGDCIPLAEVSAMRKEVEPVIESLGSRRWAVLSDLVSENVNTCVEELHNAERIQAQDEVREAEELDLLEEELLGSGFLVYECDSDSDDSDFNSDDFDFDDVHTDNEQQCLDAETVNEQHELFSLVINTPQESNHKHASSPLEVLQ